MNKSFFSSILAPIAFLCVLLLMTIFGLNAQNAPKGMVKYERTVSYNLKNYTNEFLLYGVGKVIIKSSNTNDIRCEVSICGYGKTQEEAKAKMENVEVKVLKEANWTPKMYVNMVHGKYSERNCKVVTTVYLPNTVTFQHNEDISVMEYIYRVIDKFKH